VIIDDEYAAHAALAVIMADGGLTNGSMYW